MLVNYNDVRYCAQWIADSLIVHNDVERSVIAGSIRRGKQEPKDVELVVQLNTVWKLKDTSLFGTPEAETVPTLVTKGLDEWIDTFIRRGALRWHPVNPANGARLKRFEFTELTPIPGMQLEFWICDEANAGNILTIRTGDFEFSKLLMTARRHGGLMPDTLVQMQGRLWQYACWEEAQAAREAKKPGLGVAIPCKDEQSYFEALGLSPPDPADRTEATAKSLCYSLR